MNAASIRVVAAATFVLLVAAACGGSSSGGSATSTPPAATSPAASATTSTVAGAKMTISGFNFGSPLTVKPGEAIAISNTDGVEHTVTSDDGSSFNTTVNAKGSATFAAPKRAGTYAFHCTIHPQMRDTLVVKS